MKEDCHVLLTELLFDCVYNMTDSCDKKMEYYEKMCKMDTSNLAQS